MPKICVYAIAKNESQHIKRFCESAKDADLIVIADTGSSDTTVALAKECGVIVHEISIVPWRFDSARNTVLKLVPDDVDICIALDLDEILCIGWRAEIEKVWTQDTNILEYYYNYWNLTFPCCKIHSRNGFYWKNNCHEVILPNPETIVSWARTDNILIVHLPDPHKPREYYLDLMATDVRENPDDIRNRLYYARELGVQNRYLDCMDQLDICLENVENVNVYLKDYEISYAQCTKAKCLDKLSRHTEAIESFKKACELTKREPLLDYALSCYIHKNYSEAYRLALKALKIEQRETPTFLDDPYAFTFKPHTLAAISAWNLGKHSEAVEHQKKGLEFDPGHVEMNRNLDIFMGGLLSII